MATPTLQPTSDRSQIAPVSDLCCQRLLGMIEPQLKFHQRWRRINMFAFLSVTISSLVAAMVGSVGAALKLSYAPWMAGVATCCIAADKILMLREKWKHHVETKAALEGLKALILCSPTFQDRFVNKFIEITGQYAQDLPVFEKQYTQVSPAREVSQAVHNKAQQDVTA